MKRRIICLLWIAIPLFCMAQNPLGREYEYDASGNRTCRKVITVKSLHSPVSQTESTETESLANEYYSEKIAQTEIRVYPNPTAENVTLEISDWEKLTKGVFKLFSLSGQLLQERPVVSTATVISLASLPKGTYILKVYINDHTEQWKIIKN